MGRRRRGSTTNSRIWLGQPLPRALPGLTYQRRTGYVQDARRTAHRMHAFARGLDSVHPDQATAHLALSMAFEEFAKNAWPVNDRSAIERDWKLALEEAHRAVDFDS